MTQFATTGRLTWLPRLVASDMGSPRHGRPRLDADACWRVDGSGCFSVFSVFSVSVEEVRALVDDTHDTAQVEAGTLVNVRDPT